MNNWQFLLIVATVFVTPAIDPSRSLWIAGACVVAALAVRVWDAI